MNPPSVPEDPLLLFQRDNEWHNESYNHGWRLDVDVVCRTRMMRSGIYCLRSLCHNRSHSQSLLQRHEMRALLFLGRSTRGDGWNPQRGRIKVIALVCTTNM